MEAQISSDVLSSLISSIQQLQDQVSELRQDNIRLNSEVEQIRSEVRGQFAAFPRLPVEIRCMIWKIAINAPRVYGAYPPFIQGSNLAILACKEAYRQALEERRSCAWVFYRAGFFVKADDAGRRHYYNTETDIMYNISLVDLLRQIRSVCNKCGNHPLHTDEFYIVKPTACTHRMLINKLATQYRYWHPPKETHPVDSEEYRSHGCIETLIKFDVRKLFMVVGKVTDLSEDNISKCVFIQPKDYPNKELLRGFDLNLPPVRHDLAWDVAAEKVEEILQKFRDTRTSLRKADLEMGRTLEEINEWESYEDISSWIIPKVKFVEAIPPVQANLCAHNTIRPFNFENCWNA